MVRHPDCSVADCWVNQDWFVEFRRALSSVEFQRWTLLYDELQHISLDYSSSDRVSWAWRKLKCSLLSRYTDFYPVEACRVELRG
jgi:hypothetical protein